MCSDTVDDSRTAAIERLQQLGLSAYAARTFAALVVLGQGTARDVSRDSEVPRTRVYDAVDELQEWDLVDVREGSPQEFWPVSVETAGGTFEREWRQQTAHLVEALDDLDPVEHRTEQRGVWTVEGREAVTGRVRSFLEAADDEVVYATVDDLLDESVVAALREAADRDVTVAVGGSPEVQARLRAEAPSVGTVPPPWAEADVPAGRVALVDGTTTLVSVRDDPDAGPDAGETAIWGVGAANSLVVVLKALFGP
ncbi:MAG: TrmB family transcriptional regulator [Haloferacaceae archaeon]